MSPLMLMTSSAGTRANARVPGWRVMSGRVSHVSPWTNVMLMLLAVFGCGRADNRPNREAAAQPSPVSAPAPLELRLVVPAQVRLGEPVPMRFVLENRSDQPVVVELRGDPTAFDLVVLASDGSEIWRRLEGVGVADILMSRTVGPKSEIEFTDSWTQRTNEGQPVGPGTYQVRGILPVVDVPGGWGTELQALTIFP
jgi:hypothetical protein